MFQNTRVLIAFTLFILIAGFGFLMFGTLTPPPQNTLVATSSAALSVEGERAYVSRVVDGDTLVLADGKTVRFIGIDTPETVDPRRPVGCFGKEASNETKSLLTGKEIILQKDVSDTDKYERLLRLIFLPLQDGQTLFVNDYLVREGFARVMTYPPDIKYDVAFREAETEAKTKKRGLWGSCY